MIYATYSTGEIIAKRIGNNSLIDPEKIIEIQADCDELVLINLQISGIRKCNNRVVNWYGDDAKFIAANLKL